VAPFSATSPSTPTGRGGRPSARDISGVAPLWAHGENGWSGSVPMPIAASSAPVILLASSTMIWKISAGVASRASALLSISEARSSPSESRRRRCSRSFAARSSSSAALRAVMSANEVRSATAWPEVSSSGTLITWKWRSPCARVEKLSSVSTGSPRVGAAVEV
jgi:hypothetical protein